MKRNLTVLMAGLLALTACSDSGTDPDTTAPSVAIALPAAGNVSGTVPVTATASDVGGLVSLVELTANGTVIGSDASSPYTINWNTTTVANGSYSIVATATDNSGNTATSAAVTVQVANANVTPPTVTLTSPVADAANLSGALTMTATATDDDGVATVVFLVDGNAVGFDHTAPYEYTLDSAYLGRVSGTSWVGGSHTFAARAVDSGGNEATSVSVTRTVANRPLVAVSAPITADTTWTAANVYRLTSLVYVQGAVGTPVTLTIQPGTLVVGEFGSALAVTKTARVVADGTVASPIIFTSSKPYADRRRGDWGGVVLLGEASINVTGGTNNIEGISSTPETSYGGTNDAHDCGTLRYVRIEFAGYVFGTNNELNGLTVGGCGTGTTLDYIQSHKGLDDGIEFFGGTADLKHAVISWADDDGLDWDYGWRGRVQFLVVQQEPSAGDKGFECDNNGTNQTASPLSRPVLFNVTLVGSGKAPGVAPAQAGLSLKVGTGGEMSNMIITRFSDAAVDVDNTSTVDRVTDGSLFVKSSIIYGNGGATGSWGPDPDADGINDPVLFDVVANANRTVDPQLGGFLLEAPNYVPAAGSPALTGAATPPASTFFDASATFVGAVKDAASDWTVGWTAYPQN